MAFFTTAAQSVRQTRMYVYWKTLVVALRYSFFGQKFHPIQALFAILFPLAVGLLGLTVRVGRMLDALLFPRLRNQRVEKPLYILANMRSGTTMLHRLMSMDPQFTYMRTSDTIVPTVIGYRGLEALARLDRMVGRPVDRIMRWVEGLMFSGWQGIHSVGFNKAEEDEMLWIYAALSPAVYMLYPYAGAFPTSDAVDDMPLPDREKIGQSYLGHIQRHVYASGGKRLLAKNALMAGRIETVFAQMPDMQIVHLVRHPYDSVGSMVSMYASVWKAHSPSMPMDGVISHKIAELAIDYYWRMHAFSQGLSEDQYIRIRYDDLVADPRRTVLSVYRHFGLALDASFERELERACYAQRAYKSTHSYSLEEYGIEEDWVYEQMKELFELYGFDRMRKAA